MAERVDLLDVGINYVGDFAAVERDVKRATDAQRDFVTFNEQTQDVIESIGKAARQSVEDLNIALDIVDDIRSGDFQEATEGIADLGENLSKIFEDARFAGARTFETVFSKGAELAREAAKDVGLVNDVIADIRSGDYEGAITGIGNVADAAADVFQRVEFRGSDAFENVFRKAGSLLRELAPQAQSVIDVFENFQSGNFAGALEGIGDLGDSLSDIFERADFAGSGAFANIFSGAGTLAKGFLGFVGPELANVIFSEASKAIGQLIENTRVRARRIQGIRGINENLTREDEDRIARLAPGVLGGTGIEFSEEAVQNVTDIVNSAEQAIALIDTLGEIEADTGADAERIADLLRDVNSGAIDAAQAVDSLQRQGVNISRALSESFTRIGQSVSPEEIQEAFREGRLGLDALQRGLFAEGLRGRDILSERRREADTLGRRFREFRSVDDADVQARQEFEREFGVDRANIVRATEVASALNGIREAIAGDAGGEELRQAAEELSNAAAAIREAAGPEVVDEQVEIDASG